MSVLLTYCLLWHNRSRQAFGDTKTLRLYDVQKTNCGFEGVRMYNMLTITACKIDYDKNNPVFRF